MENKEKFIEWDYDIPILNNRFIMGGVGLALGIPFGLLALLIGGIFLKDYLDGGLLPDFTGLIYASVLLAVLILLSAVFILVVYQNKYRAHFKIDDQCVQFLTRASEKAKNTVINTISMAGNLAAGNLGAASAAFAAQHKQNGSIEWKEVDRLQVYEKQRVIRLRGGFGNRIDVYCHPEDFELVKRYINERVELVKK
jgi:hypothetical protein